jgi:hypothetical protein
MMRKKILLRRSEKNGFFKGFYAAFDVHAV